MKLQGKVAVVTGAGSGIGRATALVLAAEGAAVVANDVTQERAQATIDELPVDAPRGLAVGADVSDSGAVDAMYAQVDDRYGRVDVAVNVAGIPWGDPDEGARFNRSVDDMVAEMAAGRPPAAKWDFFVNISDESFAHMLAVHLFGTFYCTRAAARRMMQQGSGSIVNFGSGAAVMGFPGSAHYSAAKAGILGLTRAAATELGGWGVRVNAICPGAVDTPMLANLPPAFTAMGVARSPLGRMAAPEEIASVALFLACDDSSYCTGQTLEPNGGMHM